MAHRYIEHPYAECIFGVLNHLPWMWKVKEDSIRHIFQLKAISTDIPVPNCDNLVQTMLFKFLSSFVSSLLMEVKGVQVARGSNGASKSM